MAERSDIKGLTTVKKNRKPQWIVPTNPACGQMSKAEYVEYMVKLKKAHFAGEDARRKVMAEKLPDAPPEKIEEEVKKEKAIDQIEELEEEMAEIRGKLADAEKALLDNPKKRGLKAQVTRFNNQLAKLDSLTK